MLALSPAYHNDYWYGVLRKSPKSMTSRARRNHTPAFQAQVALAALKSDKTLADLVERSSWYARLAAQQFSA